MQKDTCRRPIIACLLTGSALLASATSEAAFKDAFNTPPAGWTGHVFKLSQDYPTSTPSIGTHPWSAFDFTSPTDAPKYMQAVLDYCLKGNTSANAEDNLDVTNNHVRKWYHAPWLDYKESRGREFIHGMTAERGSKAKELGPAQTHAAKTWAVGFYNARGGYVIGKVWKDPAHPDPRKSKFLSNTVACKFLFTTAPLAEVPYLDGTLTWQGDINRATGTGARPLLRLLQLDIAVKDTRANSSIGWVFGTFQYEKAASASANWWEHMVPVGLMWSNDLTHLLADQPPTTLWINDERSEKLHIGFRQQLLDGPIDNPHASCTACHGFAQVNRVDNASPALPSPPTTDTLSATRIKAYFTDIKAATALSADYVSLDYSLQLQLGISNALDAGEASLPADLLTPSAAPAHAAAAPRAVATKVKPVTRGDE